MGECGCGEMTNYEAYKIGDYILAVEQYLGCEYCHTGLMITLHLFTQEEAKEYLIETNKEFKPDEYGHAQLDFPIIGSNELIKAAKQMGIDCISREYGNLESIFEDVGLNLLRIGTGFLNNER